MSKGLRGKFVSWGVSKVTQSPVTQKPIIAALACCFFPGVEPQTLDEWKLLIQLSPQCSSVGDSEQVPGVNGSSWSNGSSDCGGKISPESLTLMLARTAGPDRAMAVLEECGVQVVLSQQSELVCELLRVTEKRQRWVTVQVTKL